MKNVRRSTHIRIVIASTLVMLVTGCAHVPTANQTVAVPAPARSLDVLEVAVDAAKAVGLPAVTKLDKATGVVEFGSFDTPAAGYAAQVRRRGDGELDVTVKRGSGDGADGVEEKTKEFVAALEARLKQRPASRATPPASPSPPPSSPPPPTPAPAATPAAPAPPAPIPPPQEPPPAPAPRAITLIVTVPRANLREAGHAKAKLVRVLPRNTRVTVLGKANQWYLVRLHDGTEGWLAESVTSPAR